jgi:hypothetical protein
MNKPSLLLLQLSLLLVVCTTPGCKKSSGSGASPELSFTLKGTTQLNCPLTFQSNIQASSYTGIFGDGTRDYTAMPVHRYSTADTYTVQLFINGDSTNIARKKVGVGSGCYITRSGARIAGGTLVFSSNADTSSKLQWNFGDGATSPLFSPSHTFSSTGSYTITLIVDDETSKPISAKIDIVRDPLYTYSIGGLRNWHHANTFFSPNPRSTTTTNEDLSFSVNIIDPLTVSIGVDTFNYVSSGPGDLLTYGLHNFPILSEFYGYLYYFSGNDSISVYKHRYIASGTSIDDSYTTY